MDTALRELSEEELDSIIEEHRKWLISKGTEGEIADLSRTNLKGKKIIKTDRYGSMGNIPVLSKANFHGSNLSGVVLTYSHLQESDLSETILDECNFSYAKLDGANIQGVISATDAIFKKSELKNVDFNGSNLRGTDFSEANLDFAILRDADLQEADFADIKWLSTEQLSGTNLTGAKNLREDISKFEGLKEAEEASKNTKKIFQLMFGACIFVWLIIATTTDLRLITNSPSSPLPIISISIPIVLFYYIAPFFLFGLYLYFNVYLQRLWEKWAVLPAFFPDGTPLYKRIYPWFFNGLVVYYFKRLREKRPPLSCLQMILSRLLAWWIVPITLLIIWIRYLPAHDWVGTCMNAIALALSIISAVGFQRLCASTLTGNVLERYRINKLIEDRRSYTWGISLIFIIISFYWLSVGAINGVPKYAHDFTTLNPINIRRLFPSILHPICSPFANLLDCDISNKPVNWTGKSNEELILVKGANLVGKNLRYAMARRAFLAKADLSLADLRGAEFSGANFQCANLRYAKLQEINFSRANLQGADLSHTDLKEAFLVEGNFKEAKLVVADMQYLNLLQGADFQNADLSSAKLRGSRLGGSNFQNANLEKTDLRETFSGIAIFIQVSPSKRTLKTLICTNFQGANLTEADLRGADLTHATGLTKEQIKSVIIDEKTRLPNYLLKD
jgi:uncharacterized protein YjbI with pentapeptide repeats